jgi:hypothetical protein
MFNRFGHLSDTLAVTVVRNMDDLMTPLFEDEDPTGFGWLSSVTDAGHD